MKALTEDLFILASIHVFQIRNVNNVGNYFSVYVCVHYWLTT